MKYWVDWFDEETHDDGSFVVEAPHPQGAIRRAFDQQGIKSEHIVRVSREGWRH